MVIPEAETLLEDLRARGVSPRVLAAIAAVPRDRFVPPGLRARAWEDGPLPIGGGQTISQPRVVALMCDALALTGDERVLDVGTGSGWHAALLARLAAHVWTVERDPAIARQGAANLSAAGASNVTTVVGDGVRALDDEAAFDAINVAAAGGERDLAELMARLADGGRLVAPVRAGRHQRLIVAERRGDDLRRRDLGRVSFVPLRRAPPG
jgi:protein-L-isoaspartate(D-aspartate) O-methyltransferase